MYYNALIDFDGTICNSHKAVYKCYNEILKDKNIKQAEIESFVSSGIDLRETLTELTGEKGRQIDSLVTTYRELYADIELSNSSLYEGVEDFLHSLYRHSVNIVIVSNKGLSSIEKTFKYFNLDKIITGIVADVGSGGPKHNSELCLKEIQKLIPDQPLSSMLLIGDTVADIVFAKSVGVSVGYVRQGYGTLTEVASIQPDYMEDSLADFFRYFKRV